jgi:uncharacterized protein
VSGEQQYFFLTKQGCLYIIPILQPRQLKEMAIKINDIPPEGLTLELAQKLDLFDKGADFAEFTANLRIKPGGKGIVQIAGRVQATAILECSRCLISFPYKIDNELTVDLAPVNSLGAGPEHELVSGELDTEFYQGDEIDPIEFVKEQLLIAVPMVPLHHPECKGLCSICGTDLNKSECDHRQNEPGDSGPFAALKDFLKK